MFTQDFDLPTEKELTVPEVNISGLALRAAANYLGKFCEDVNNEFILCYSELNDPRKCINEGKDVTACSLNFFRKLKKNCRQEFEAYVNCINATSPNYGFDTCRNRQGVLDKCVLDKLQIERPDFGYFCEAKVHASKRPKPPPPKPDVFPDASDSLPKDRPLKGSKYYSRYMWLE